jgi:hypothetical protein
VVAQHYLAAVRREALGLSEQTRVQCCPDRTKQSQVAVSPDSGKTNLRQESDSHR